MLDDLGSTEAVLLAFAAAFAPAALFAATHPSRTTALVVLDGYADAGGTAFVGDEVQAAWVRMWGSGKLQYLGNPDMPWNEEIRTTWARHDRLAASPRTVADLFDEDLDGVAGKLDAAIRSAAYPLRTGRTTKIAAPGKYAP